MTPERETVKEYLNRVIFGTDTPAGKAFDLVLIYSIFVSVAVVMLDSLQVFAVEFKLYLNAAEWFFTVLFSVEYALRIYCTPKRWRYVRSFYGIIDLLAILPTYLALFIGNINYLVVIRLLRVLRIFRVLKLMRYLEEANLLTRAILASQRKILVFFGTVLVLATVFGALMFVVEGGGHGFTSIPNSIYWTIVTITTVGYGDITPQTSLGKIIASLAMLTGYSIIAVPTGILTAELNQELMRERVKHACPACHGVGHERDATYCKFCGEELPKRTHL
ncbi:ion transporter [Halioxenophilus sp. WMMB6]|uniref:ion transporter n=1 Tax=Halioxenophilus sp. WMMB6 TaxID=3073815 RepID=UPI00295EFB1B|nr:ion transporter [Halioxenophilus sp. WMMB6]